MTVMPRSFRSARLPMPVMPAGVMVAATLALAAPAAARCIPVAGLEGPALDRAAGPTPALVQALVQGRPRIAGRNRLLRRVQQTDDTSGKKSGDGTGGRSKSGAAAKLRGPALPAGHVEVTFLGHSSFLIRTHKNVTAITDYNGYLRAPYAPDIVTMNRAHNTHYTDAVEPGVKHILRGWPQKGKIPRYDVRMGDLRVTNVPTNIRDGGNGDFGIAGNSIFIFESAGLCIVHLGHLHHMLRPGHAGRVGSVDILLAPIDDVWTMSHADLVKVIDRLQPVVVIPMHFGSGDTLARFVALMKPRKYAIKIATGNSARFMKATLPVPTVLVLKGGWF